MAGAMRKMGIYLGLVEDDDRHTLADEYETDGSSARVRDRAEYTRSHRDEYDAEPAPKQQDYDAVEPAAPVRRTPSTVTSQRWSAQPESAESNYRITTLHPRTYNEARTIGEQFRDGVPVIINLSEMDDADAKRLVDFAAGLTFGLRGSIERVTNKVFLLSPQKVKVTAEDKARIVEGGFFNQS